MCFTLQSKTRSYAPQRARSATRHEEKQPQDQKQQVNQQIFCSFALLRALRESAALRGENARHAVINNQSYAPLRKVLHATIKSQKLFTTANMAKPCANKRELGIANWPLNTDVIGARSATRHEEYQHQHQSKAKAIHHGEYGEAMC